MNAAALRGGLGVLALGRVSLMLSSVVSIRLSTGLLGPAQMGVMNLVLSTVNLFALLVAAFSLFFYRQVVEWQVEGRLLPNIVRYARFLVAAAGLACLLVPVVYLRSDSPWQGIPSPWLLGLLAGNVLLVPMNGALLYCLNAIGRRGAYVCLSNLSSWGGLGLAAALALAFAPDAEPWLAGLLCGQVLSLLAAAALLVRALRGGAVSASRDAPPGTVSDDFRPRSVLAFSWPLLICTGLYWVQRNSFAPWMAATAGAHVLGLFSVAFSVGLLAMAAFDTLFTEYYAPIFYRSIAGGDAALCTPAWNRYAAALMPAVLVVFFFVAANGQVLLQVLVSPDFHGLGWVVACGAASQLLISVYSAHVLLASSVMDNRVLVLPNIAGAATTVATLLLLLPWNAMLAAALAVNAGLLTTVLVASVRMQGLYRTRWPLRRLAWAAAAAFPLLVLPPLMSSLLSFVQPWLGLALILGLGGLYAAMLQVRLARAWI
jgi:O-antigen/teichoic acid export membrane protein